MRRVSLYANCQQYMHSGAAFPYLLVASVSSVWPLQGAAEGGTPLTVIGSGFSAAAEALGALRCRFGIVIVAVAYATQSALTCNTTASPPDLLSVEVTTNGREYTTNSVQFKLVAFAIRGITPWSGPSLGDTVVTIAGLRLGAAAEELRCHFGRLLTSQAASAHGADGVRCVTPSTLPTGWSAVELSAHGTTLRSGSSLYVHCT
jgi:hypothetical protein